MKILQVVNSLLRDRRSLYEAAREGKNTASLCGTLLLIFVVTAGAYGAVMGAFRWIHPDYFFSDFELVVAGQAPVRGKIAGMSVENKTIYTVGALTSSTEQATIRFNVSMPTEAYEVTQIGMEKGYGKVVLAAKSVLQERDAWRLPLIVAVKTPLLFILTLAVCALALYALNLLFGMELRFLPTMIVILFALAGIGIVLAVFVPISLLFTVVTESYHFMKMLHVLVFAVAGLFGLKILGEAIMEVGSGPSGTIPPPLPRRSPTALVLVWLLLYCLVGAQVAWSMKPFLGTPYLPDTPPFRIERGNIFVSTLGSAQAMR